MRTPTRIAGLTLLLSLIVLAGVVPAATLTLSAATRVVLPTNTPRGVTVTTPTPVVILPLPARLCTDCQRVRLRSAPGTAGTIMLVLRPEARFLISARSDDSLWVQITLDDGTVGWISADFVRQPDLKPFSTAVIDALPIGGVTVEASPSPTSSLNIPPFLSGITSRSRLLFLEGKKLGNRANVFVRIGDSITVSPNFLYDIGIGKVDLGAYGGLGGVINFYSSFDARNGNSFVMTPIAAGAGWTLNQLLQPGYSYPEACGQDTPLVCEYKLSKPAVALIMIGTNDSGSGSAEQFGVQLRTVVQTSIDMGVIPVLSTIPPKRIDDDQSRRVDTFNRVIRQTALQFEIPLWDYYYSMSQLPNGGMATDGLHPSVPPDGRVYRFSVENLQYGYTLRNLQALQVLDTLWRLVLY